MDKSRRHSNRHTLQSIAGVLGVSITTVSRVINGKSRQYGISHKTEQRVLKYTRKLNFSPDPVARGLRLNKMLTIGLVVPDLLNPFFAKIARCVSNEARKRSYVVQIFDAFNDANIEKDALNQLMARNIDGLVLCPTSQKTDHFKELLKLQLPTVLVDRYAPGIDLPYAVSDNRSGTHMAACHLLENGHKKIACLTGTPATSVSKDRLKGFQQALREHSIRVRKKLIAGDCYTKESGYHATRQILSSGEPFTAVLAMCSQIALGALRALAEAGKRVPEDVSLICFDDLDGVEFMQTPLTVVEQAVDTMGQAASEMLFQRIDTPETPGTQKQIIPVHLIKRQSVRRNSTATR